MRRVLLLGLLLTSAVLMVSAEEEETVVDDVDRTDFSDPALDSDADKVREASGPHSEVEVASLLIDLAEDGKVPVGVGSYVLVALANSGAKMFNVSAMSATLSSAEGKVVQKFAKHEYGDSMGPREQRSVRFEFTPSEETPLGQYTLDWKVFYNDKNKDQFVDAGSEAFVLVPMPPSLDARLRLIKIVGGGALLLLVLLLMLGKGGSGAAEKPPTKAAAAKGGSPAKSGDEWLTGTLAGTENQAPKPRGSKKTR